MKDPILDELRRIRERQFAEFGYDLRRMIEHDMRQQYTRGRKVVSFTPTQRNPKRPV